jgi:hypothetical protein
MYATFQLRHRPLDLLRDRRGCADPCRASTRASDAERRHGIACVVSVPEPIRGTAQAHDNQGAAMPTVIAYHDVKDTDHWLASPKREEFFGPLGVTNIRTFVDPTNRTRVAVLMDVPDMDAVMAAMETPEAAEAMAHDGVLPETLVIVVEA